MKLIQAAAIIIVIMLSLLMMQQAWERQQTIEGLQARIDSLVVERSLEWDVAQFYPDSIYFMHLSGEITWYIRKEAR